MVVWNFDLLWKKLWFYGQKIYGTIVKIMVLLKTLWYYTEDYWNSSYEGKQQGSLPKTMKL